MYGSVILDVRQQGEIIEAVGTLLGAVSILRVFSDSIDEGIQIRDNARIIDLIADAVDGSTNKIDKVMQSVS